MKGHVAPENLNGGINNQTSASIVFDRQPSYFSLWGMVCYSTLFHVMTGQVTYIWLLSLYSKGAHSILWLGLHSYIHPASYHSLFTMLSLSPTPGCRITKRCSECSRPCSVCAGVSLLCSSLHTAAKPSVTVWVSGVPLCKDVKVCHWASLRECSQMLSCSSSRLPAEVYNA